MGKTITNEASEFDSGIDACAYNGFYGLKIAVFICTPIDAIILFLLYWCFFKP